MPAPQLDADGREIRLDSFLVGTTLDRAVSLHDFDQELRSRLTVILGVIETSLRFFVGHRLGAIDMFAHRRPEVLGAVRAHRAGDPAGPSPAYTEWLEEYDRHESRARDAFVLHFRERYGPHLPIWVATEVMSFGVLSNLYRLMPQLDQEVLAARLQVSTADGRGDRGALANWLNSLRNVRNICAHHGRLWNRTFDVLIDAPGQSRTDPGSPLRRLAEGRENNKLFDVLLIMRYLYLSLAPERTDVVDLADVIERHSARLGVRPSQLGFPDGWRADPIWDRALALEPVPMVAASLLDRAASLTATEARAGLLGAAVEDVSVARTAGHEERATKAAQRRLLRTYRAYRVVIEVELGGAKHYPAFQFRDGTIIDALAEINKHLAERCGEAHPAYVASALLDWWQTPHPDLPRHADGATRSPLDLLILEPEADFARIIDAAGATATFLAPHVSPQRVLEI